MDNESWRTGAEAKKWPTMFRIRDLIRTLWLPIGLPIVLYNTYKAWAYHSGKNKLRNKVVLLTGASSGIGEALAHELYQKGCKLILCARREQELQRVREDLMRSHTVQEVSPPVVLTLDLGDLNALRSKAEEALKVFGRVDILVNNGGMSYRGDVATTHVAVDVKLMVVNYLGQVALCKALLPSMLSSGAGHVVVVGSVQGKIALPHRSCYAASKHALLAFCDSLRAEVADRNIAITVVNPGYVRTNLSVNAMREDGQRHGEMDASTASGMSPEAVAKRIVKAIAMQEKEVSVCGASPRIASWIRSNFPSLYFYAMQIRARRSQPPPISSPDNSESTRGKTADLVDVSRETLGKLLGKSD